MDMPTIDARRYRRITGRLPLVWKGEGDARRYKPTTRPVVVLREQSRDCDGFDIDNLRATLPENAEAQIEETHEWAEGPCRVTAIDARELDHWHREHDHRERHWLRKGWDDDRF